MFRSVSSLETRSSESWSPRPWPPTYQRTCTSSSRRLSPSVSIWRGTGRTRTPSSGLFWLSPESIVSPGIFIRHIFRVAKMYGLYGFLFCNPKIVRIVRIFFKLYGLYGFLSWKKPGFFLIFTHFRKIFMKISKKNLVKMKLVTLIFCILNNIRLID